MRPVLFALLWHLAGGVQPRVSLHLGSSKSSTRSLVSSVPLREPTAHTSLVGDARSRHTTPPEPPDSSATRFRRNSPVRRSHSFTVPSSDEVTTNLELNCRHVTALWCLLAPASVCRHCPVRMSQTLTVESALPDTRMLLRSSMPEVRDWWPMSWCRQAPVSTSHTRIEVSSEPLTTCTPSNCSEYTRFVWPCSVWRHSSRRGSQTLTM
uniref:Putative secreted protein n=1 Tax=Ixodes ricinus TaxID=34613 RepID=A0A6B0V2P4_IXORI